MLDRISRVAQISSTVKRSILSPRFCLPGSPRGTFFRFFGRVNFSFEGVDRVQGYGHRSAGTDQAD